MRQPISNRETTATQEQVTPTTPQDHGALLIPKMRGDTQETSALAAVLRAPPGSGVSLNQPKDPSGVLTKLGLQNMEKLKRREVSKEPNAGRGIFASLGALGMAAAYFGDERAKDDARTELDRDFDFVPNFYLSLPTTLRGNGIDMTKGRTSAPSVSWPHESGVGQAHDRNIRGAGVMIGVLDTGVDADHTEIVNHLVTYRYVSFHPNTPYWPPRDVRGFDIDGHGTHVCGILAGRTVGVAPEARLFVASVLESETTYTSLVRVAYGLDWLLRHFSAPGNEYRPAIINMSLGFPNTLVGSEDYKDRLFAIRRLLQTAEEANVLPIVAIGNDGADRFCYPAAYPEALAIGAVDMRHSRASFSGSTPAGVAPNKPDVYGYGVEIYSSLDRDYNGQSSYGRMSGTSMAAPYVTGVAALHLCKNPGLSARDLRRTIVDSALALTGIAEAGIACFESPAIPLGRKKAIRSRVRRKEQPAV